MSRAVTPSFKWFESQTAKCEYIGSHRPHIAVANAALKQIEGHRNGPQILRNILAENLQWQLIPEESANQSRASCRPSKGSDSGFGIAHGLKPASQV